MSGLIARLVRLLVGVPLDAADEQRYQDERRTHNRRNVRVVALAMLPLHLMLLVLYWPAEGPLAHPTEFRATICLINLAAMPIVGLTAVLVHYVEPRWWPGHWRGWATDLFTLLYVLFAACLSVNAQRLNGNINAFTIGVLGSTLLLRHRAWAALLVTGAGLATLVVGVLLVQPLREIRVITVTPGIAVTLLALVLSRFNVATARGELMARVTIERQRAELAALNDDLERRVEARAGEIEKLNHHLREQVIDRSRQLAHALKALGPRSPAALQGGDLLDGRVEIVERIGGGAMGEVYRGQDRILGRPVAVKVLRPDSGVSTDVWVRFASEAEAAAAVRHPCVVHTLHVGITDDGRLYQLQELIEGISLAETLTGGARWEASSAARIGARIADALAAAHAVGVVHRDVKPRNVIITTTAPGVHLFDFGISRIHRAEVGATEIHTVIGTPVYMAPEQIATPDAVAAPCDVYGLGVLLHELIAGRPPFKGTTQDLLHQHVHQPAPRLPDERAPAALADLVLRCLAKLPATRPTSAELAVELSALADAGEAPAAESLPRPQPPDTGDTVQLRA